MNQILLTKDNSYLYNNIIAMKKKSKKTYLIVFFISILLCFLIILYIFFSYITKLEENKKTNIIKEKYAISTLYSSNTKYTSISLSNNLSIIGLIEIPSINISYPIISNTTEELLKISVCRFSGPLPNRNGNLCIAGHNYKNDLMFSKLSELKINDTLFITDLNNVKIEYIIYKKNIVNEKDLNCINNSDNIELTLITCANDNNSKRIVIKAKVKE